MSVRIGSTRRIALFLGVFLAFGLGTNARAGYFVTAFAGSGGGGAYLFGDVNNSTGSAATNEIGYTDGVNTYSSAGVSSVDLSTGSLHSLASVDYGYVPSALPNLTSSFQFGNSSFGDSLTFLGDFTGQQATFNISVDGTFSGSAAFNGSDFQFMVLPAGTIDANAGNTLNIFNNPGNVAIVNDINSLDQLTTLPLTYSVNVTLNGHDPTIEFAANLDIVTSANLGQSFTADFSNTATITLAAPAGVIVQSASGVFPGTVPVPEPGSLSLSVAGLVLAGLFNRSRNRRTRV